MTTRERAIEAIANPKYDGIARISEHEGGPWNPAVEYAKKQIKSLNDAGMVIIDRDDVVMAKDAAVAISWEDPGSGGWEALVDRLKEALGEST